MKFSIFNQYGAANSIPVFEAFSQGIKNIGLDLNYHDLHADVFVIWSVLWHGKMKRNQDIWNLAKKENKKIIILEIGGLIRGKTWRVGLNHVNNLGTFYKDESFDYERPKKLGIFIKKWRNNGEHILICGQHSRSQQWINRPPPEIWLNDLVKDLRKVTNRKIVLRPHPRDHNWVKFLPKLDIDIHIPKKIENTYDDFNHEEDFKNAHLVISPSGNTGIHSLIAGIPVFCDKDSLAWPLSIKNLENIENIIYPDRDDWLTRISHTEWLLEELEKGIPIERIFKKVDNF